MNNELGRKITSLTLMTIMLAGGMVIAAPGMTPAAHAANATLFVSAESSEFDNIFGGAQVIEIVVSDPLIASLDDVHGSPDVTVNGSDVVMAQASDGSWYAYVADKDFANTADVADTADDTGLDFGLACSGATANVLTGTSGAAFGSTTTDVWFSAKTFASFSGQVPLTTGTACVDSDSDNSAAEDSTLLITGAKTLVAAASPVTLGQIDLNDVDSVSYTHLTLPTICSV